MDPNECLNRLREHALAILLLAEERHEAENLTDPMQALRALRAECDRADDMAALFISLDEWLQRGGFAPAGWHLKPESRMAALLADDEPNGV